MAQGRYIDGVEASKLHLFSNQSRMNEAKVDMDYGNIISLAAIVVGYLQFSKQLERQTYEIKLKMADQKNQSYKELILAERVKRNNMIRKSMVTLIRYLNEYVSLYSVRGDNKTGFKKLDKLERKCGDEEWFQKEYKRLIGINEKTNDKIDEIIKKIIEERSVLLITLGYKYSDRLVEIKNHIEKYLQIGATLGNVESIETIGIYKKLDELEDLIVSLLVNMIDDDWHDIGEEVRKIYELQKIENNK